MKHHAFSAACCRHQPMAAGLAALAHPARIEIIRLLSGLDACCCKDVVAHLHLAQSTVSQHLKVLVDAGLLRMRPERQTSRYEVDAEALASVSRALGELAEACAAAGASMREPETALGKNDAQIQ